MQRHSHSVTRRIKVYPWEAINRVRGHSYTETVTMSKFSVLGFMGHTFSIVNVLLPRPSLSWCLLAWSCADGRSCLISWGGVQGCKLTFRYLAINPQKSIQTWWQTPNYIPLVKDKIRMWNCICLRQGFYWKDHFVNITKPSDQIWRHNHVWSACVKSSYAYTVLIFQSAWLVSLD